MCSEHQALRPKSSSMCAGLGGWAQAEQIRLWKEYIAWEKSNPQRLDGPAVAQRVSLAYEQALMPLMHCPEVGLKDQLAWKTLQVSALQFLQATIWRLRHNLQWLNNKDNICKMITSLCVVIWQSSSNTQCCRCLANALAKKKGGLASTGKGGTHIALRH